MLSTARPRAWSALADAMQRLGKKKSTPAYRARLRLQPRERCFLARGRRHASRPAAAWSARRGRAGTALDAAPPSNRQHGARGTEASARRQDRCASAAQPQTQPVGAQTCEDHVRRKLDGLQRHAKQRLGRRDPDDEKVPAATCGVWSAPACAKAWRDLSTWRGFQHGSRPPPPSRGLQNRSPSTSMTATTLVVSVHLQRTTTAISSCAGLPDCVSPEPPAARTGRT